MQYTIGKISILVVFSLIFFFSTLSAQISWCNENGINSITGQPCVNAIHTAVPFLGIAPDARSAGMGDAGIATSADANALHFNSSKLAFAEDRFGFSANYTPWLRALGLRDINLFYLTNYVRLDEQQTVGVGFRYFDLEELFNSDVYQMNLGFKPKEYELAISYNRQLNERFAVGLTAKYIYSKLGVDDDWRYLSVDAQAIACDLSFTYKRPLTDALELTVGSAVTNLGSKMTYSDDIRAAHLPTNLGIGSGIKWEINDLHNLQFAFDINRLIVPSSSNGFAEKMRENRYSFGTEYRYKHLAARIGHFNEHKMKGGRKYMTYGLGFNYAFATLNLSYLQITTQGRHPLDNTVRLSLMLDFGEIF